MSGANLFVGLIALAGAAALGWRIVQAAKTGEIPVYRTRINRDAGAAKFNALVATNAAVMMLLLVIAADLLLGLGLRG